MEAGADEAAQRGGCRWFVRVVGLFGEVGPETNGRAGKESG